MFCTSRSAVKSQYMAWCSLELIVLGTVKLPCTLKMEAKVVGCGEGVISSVVVIGAQVLNDKIPPVNNDLQNLILQMPVDHSPCGHSTEPLEELAYLGW